MTAANLPDFFETSGSACEARTGMPLSLHGDDAVWLVAGGRVDVFLAKIRDGHVESALRPQFRVETGQMLCGMPPSAVEWELVATAVPGCRLLRVERAHLQAWCEEDAHHAGEVARLLDGWAENLASPLKAPVPANATALEPGWEAAGEEYVLAGGEVFLARQQTVWLTPGGGKYCFLGQDDAVIGEENGVFPLPRSFWGVTLQPGTLRAWPGGVIPTFAERWKGLAAYHQALLARLYAQAEEDDERERQRLALKSGNEARNLRDATLRLASILDGNAAQPALEGEGGTALLAACRLVGKPASIEFSAPVAVEEAGGGKRDLLGEIVEASRVRRRLVILKDTWWEKDNGNLLGFMEADKKPVALLQTSGGYALHDPARGEAYPVTAEAAARLLPFAFMFYRSFGATLVNVVEMLKFGIRGNGRDFLMVAAMGVAIGLLGMVTPMATGMLFDTVIPGAEKDQLAQLVLALVAGAFAAAMFEIARGFAMLRAEGKMDSAIQSAVWDRLLRLPVPFFRDYSAGDLAMRANGINTIRQALSGNTLHTLMSAVFAAFNLLLLFYYSTKLALLGMALVIVAVLFNVGASYLRLRHERKLAEIEGRISGLVFQLLGSIAKLRTTGAESRAFLNWAMEYGRQQEHQFKATMVGNAVGVFGAVYPTLASMVFFFAIAFFIDGDKGFSTGSFLAFNAAFGGFMGAMLGATSVLDTVLAIIPIYERAKPILQTPPEINDSKAAPGQLEGEIEVSHLCFRYAPDGPPILQDVSLHIRPGEFVAVVGSSGSGKSTLLRLLLGFETPSSGSLYYDRQDISGIDLAALRRQLGVVLQNGQLLSGDIFTNIIGSAATLTLDDAWEAATQAGIADDIRAMPMGMHTVVSDGGGTLSGGQRQRLLIARAIVNRPRILFFDEATSALDNRAQEMVSASLENLRATRIVIAHRLSTIINADRIFVMDGGRLVQSGTYAELIGMDGLFADLAKRQIV
jgi:ATP-binding cassette subfamily C protein